MCGITGYITRTNATETTIADARKNLTNLLIKSGFRGKDATGISFVKNHKLTILKKPVSSVEFIVRDDYKRVLKATGSIVIGHTRAMTQGDTSNKNNNHPLFSKNGLACVHNGMISNDDELFEKYHLDRDGEVDSEIVLKLVEHWKNKGYSTKRSIVKMTSEVKGSMACAIIDLHEPDALYLFARTNPVNLAYQKSTKTVFFASTETILTDALIKSTKYMKFFDSTTNKKDFIVQSVGTDTGLIIKNGIIKTFDIDEPKYITPVTKPYVWTDTAKQEDKKKDTNIIKATVWNRNDFSKAITNENKLAMYAKWKITKPSKHTTEQLEERLTTLIELQTEGIATYAEQIEAERIDNCLQDRYKKEHETKQEKQTELTGFYDNYAKWE